MNTTGVMRWRRLMTRLLLQDAARRYGVGLTIVSMTLVYLGRSLPPWTIRQWLWAIGPGPATATLAAATAAYVLATLPVARLVLASHRLEYWRQFAIGPWQWRRLQWSNLAIVNLPILAWIAYMAAPAPGPAAPLIAAAGYALVLSLQTWAVARWRPRTRMRWVPAVTAPWSAIARLHLLVTWRRMRTAALACAGLQLAMAGLATIGAHHVAVVQPWAAWPLIRTLALLGAFAVVWLAAAATQALDRDRWFLDAVGIGPRQVLVGRIVAGLAIGLPTIAGAIVAGLMLGPASALRGGLVGLTTVSLASATACNLVASAEARRSIHTIRPTTVALRAVAALLLINIAGLVAIAAVAALEAMAAQRSVRRAAIVRARLETSTKDDDHDVPA